MLLQALKVAFDCLADVFGGLGAGLALGNAAGQSRASGNKHPVLVLLQIDTILHYSTFYQSVDGRNRNGDALPRSARRGRRGGAGGRHGRKTWKHAVPALVTLGSRPAGDGSSRRGAYRMFSGRLDEMGDEWHVRLQEWYERSLQKLRKKWWLWPLVFVVELIWHRIYGAVNEFLDAQAGTMTDISNVMGHVPADPVTVSVVTGVIIIIALVVHAYIDTWRSQASLRQTSGSGGGVQQPRFLALLCPLCVFPTRNLECCNSIRPEQETKREAIWAYTR